MSIFLNSSLRNDCILKAFKLRVRCKFGHERSEGPKYLTSSLKAEYNRCVHYFIYDQQHTGCPKIRSVVDVTLAYGLPRRYRISSKPAVKIKTTKK